MHRWYQPTGPLCSQMNLGKVLNWHGFMLGCSVDRTWTTARKRGEQGSLALVVHKKKKKKERKPKHPPSFLAGWLENYICPIAVCVSTGLRGCLSQLHYTAIRVTEKAFDSSLPPSAIFNRLTAGRAQKSQVPGEIKQVSARMSILNPTNTLRQEILREKNRSNHLTPGQHREE